MPVAAYLTVAELARELRCHVRTARRWCASWLHLAGSFIVPRVRLWRSGRRGHPLYLVELASLRAWLRRAFTPANTNAVAND